MSEELTVSSGDRGSGSGSFMKNLGMYAHIAEISLIAGSAIYFYSRNAKLEARIAELEKKLSDHSPATAAQQSPEDKQKELNDMASFIYRKLHQELHQELREEREQGKKKKKVRAEEYHEGDGSSSPVEIQVSTSTDLDDDIENELKKEM
jgi:iron-sulfur cluster repair protein YtfE (RIC family)